MATLDTMQGLIKLEKAEVGILSHLPGLPLLIRLSSRFP